jgi:hypothetical protein
MLYSAMQEEENKINECTSTTNTNVSIPNITILLHVIEHQPYYYSRGNERNAMGNETKSQSPVPYNTHPTWPVHGNKSREGGRHTERW